MIRITGDFWPNVYPDKDWVTDTVTSKRELISLLGCAEPNTEYSRLAVEIFLLDRSLTDSPDIDNAQANTLKP